jgi:hypothetical protein
MGACVAALFAALVLLQTPTAQAFEWLAGADENGGVPVGAGEFEVDVPRGPVTVYTYRPAAATADSPIWIVMHGVRRDVGRHIAFDYYDSWERLAEQHGAVLLVPEFTEVKWPTFWNYTLGNIRTPDLRPIPWSHSSFHVGEPSAQIQHLWPRGGRAVRATVCHPLGGTAYSSRGRGQPRLVYASR